MCADENGFSFNHSIITSDGSDAILNIHGNPVQSGKLDFKPYIQKASEDTLINNISSSLLGDFIIKWYKNGSLEWSGNIVPDVFEKPEKSLGYFTSLRAVDFDILKSETFDLEEGVRTPISILQKIFRTLPVKMDIVTRTSWKEEHLDNSITGTYDFLNRIFVKTIALREFLEDGGHRPLSMSKVLDKMANFGLIIRVMNGAIYVEQASAYNDPKNVLECRYGIGVEETQKSKQFVDLTEKGYTDHTAGSPAVKFGSLNRLYSPIKSVENTFEHRSEGTTL